MIFEIRKFKLFFIVGCLFLLTVSFGCNSTFSVKKNSNSRTKIVNGKSVDQPTTDAADTLASNGSTEDTAPAVVIPVELSFIGLSADNAFIDKNAKYKIQVDVKKASSNVEIDLFYSPKSGGCDTSAKENGWISIAEDLSLSDIDDFGWDTSAVLAGSYHLCVLVKEDGGGIRAKQSSGKVFILEPGERATVDTAAPTCEQLSASGELVLLFSKGMQADSISFDGDLAPSVGQKVFSQTAIGDDTLTLTPSAAWPHGPGRTLLVSGKDKEGIPMNPQMIRIDVSTGNIFYVHPSGDDGNDGGFSSPRKTIVAALSLLSSGDRLNLSEGTYTETAILPDGVSLYGGYDSTDFCSRDPKTYITEVYHSIGMDCGVNWVNKAVLLLQDQNTTSWNSPVKGPPTVINGLKIDSTDIHTPICMEGANLELYNSHLIVGSGIADAISNRVVFKNNLLEGGLIDLTSRNLHLSENNLNLAIFVLNNMFRGNDAKVVIENNYINDPTDGYVSFSLDTNKYDIVMRNNLINAKSGVSVNTTSSTDSKFIFTNNILRVKEGSYGVQIEDGHVFTDEVLIANNTIYLDGTGSQPTAKGIGATGPNTNVANNIVFFKSTANPTSTCFDTGSMSGKGIGGVDNNLFFGCDTLLKYDGVTKNTIIDVNSVAEANNNISIDPQFLDATGLDFRLSSSTPASVLTGGVDGEAANWGINSDFYGAYRRANWAIGAFNKDYDSADVLYVSKAGNDSNPGTRASPKLTITSALSGLSSGEVFVAEGEYTETVTISNDVSLFGGFDSTNWLKRAPSEMQSIIKVENGVSNSAKGTTSTVVTTSSLTLGQKIEGFHIEPPASPGDEDPTAIEVGKNMSISNNKITNTSDQPEGYGIYALDASDSKVSSNTIKGFKYGFTMENAVNHNIFENRFLENQTGLTVGKGSSNVAVRNNVVVSRTTAPNGENVVGLTVEDGGDTINEITNNSFLINSPSPAAGILLNGKASRASNNIVLLDSSWGSESVCMSEHSPSYRPDEIKNNSFYGCDVIYSVTDSSCAGANDCADLATFEAMSANFAGNVNVDPKVFVYDLEESLLTCIDPPSSVSEGGLDGDSEGWGYDFDALGVSRWGDWSIGAVECD